MSRRYHTVVDGKRTLKHRYLMEQYLGRILSDDEIVHHINEDSKDNRIENLQILTDSEHKRFHAKKSLNCYMGMLGKKHTEETKRKLSESKVGEKNHRFIKGLVSKRILRLRLKRAEERRSRFVP